MSSKVSVDYCTGHELISRELGVKALVKNDQSEYGGGPPQTGIVK